jgi:signal transduction histidine kinase
MIASAVWAFCYLLMLVAPTPAVAIAAETVGAGFSSFVAVLWFLFVVEYTGHGAWLTRPRLAALVAEPAIYCALLATNPIHGYLRTDVQAVTYAGLTHVSAAASPVLVGQVLFIYLPNLFGFALLGRFFLATRNVYRKQTTAILVGGVTVVGANLAFLVGFTPHPAFNPTPLFFVTNGVIIGVALFRYDFLEVVPLAADMLIEEMNDPVVVVDTADEVVDVNTATLALFDDDPVGEALAAVAPDLATVIESGEQFTRETTDGRTAYSPRGTVITDQYGIERGTLVVLRDVTMQVRRRTELERQNERLEEFVSVVSHDLRNPLSVAHAYARTALDEGDVSYVGQTVESLDRMDELIGDLLTLAREGRAVDELTPVSLEATAREAWQQVETADARLVTGADITLTADGRRLKQLFENLFRNAIEHGGPEVTVTVGDLVDGKGFYVADDGSGIPEEEREAVFEHGYTSSEDGTGFGLAIIRTIVEAHGWSVGLAESEDGGARFEITGVHADRKRLAAA